jgi:hypothetical protein
MLKRAAFLLAFAVTVPAGAGEPLTMRLTPPVALEPAALTVHTVIETDPDNRALQVVAQSQDYYRSSWIQLDGSNAPRLNVFEFKNLPTGTYEVVGVLVASDGARTTAARFFHVTPALGSSR